jgi:hypothetical protein
MKINERYKTYKLHGNISIKIVGEDEVVFEKENLIVNSARTILSYAIAEGGMNIVNLKLGRNGHISDPLSPIPPQITDTSLIDTAPFTKPVTTYIYLPDITNATSVAFSFVIEKPEGNGTGVVEYTEAGLFTSNGKMFSRVTFPSLAKDSTRKIIIDWTINF